MHPIHLLLARDHRRLERLLARADRSRSAYERFRAGLLRHIAMEERILLPAARRANGGEPIADAERLRIDHARLACLLVPTPTPRIFEEIRDILGPHDRLEEGPDGVYEAAIALIGEEDAPFIDQALRDQPEVRLRPMWPAEGRMLRRG